VIIDIVLITGVGLTSKRQVVMTSIELFILTVVAIATFVHTTLYVPSTISPVAGFAWATRLEPSGLRRLSSCSSIGLGCYLEPG
jgi:hypothetical protein